MRDGISGGVHFGLALGVITTHAISDVLSDALGIHIAKDADRGHSVRHVWQATLATFAAKFSMASTFVVPVLLLPLDLAILASVTSGLLVIALLAAVVTHFVGDAVARIFGTPGMGA